VPNIQNNKLHLQNFYSNAILLHNF